VAAAPQTTAATAPRLAATPPKDAAPPKGEVLVQGYRKVVVNGEPVYCRDDLATGSRIVRDPVCLTQAQLQAEQATAQQFIQAVQRLGSFGGNTPMQGMLPY
jgi:hypothetical protein